MRGPNLERLVMVFVLSLTGCGDAVFRFDGPDDPKRPMGTTWINPRAPLGGTPGLADVGRVTEATRFLEEATGDISVRVGGAEGVARPDIPSGVEGFGWMYWDVVGDARIEVDILAAERCDVSVLMRATRLDGEPPYAAGIFDSETSTVLFALRNVAQSLAPTITGTVAGLELPITLRADREGALFSVYFRERGDLAWKRVGTSREISGLQTGSIGVAVSGPVDGRCLLSPPRLESLQSIP